MSTLADRIIKFNRELKFTGSLPEGVDVMNPYSENKTAFKASSEFYKKFYDDNLPRNIILGINPGRFGSGVTGVAFTDTKRLKNECGIQISGPDTHEPSSVFIYEMIKAFGGVKEFYSRFYINSVCPLGFTSLNNKGRRVNYNYYDNQQLMESSRDFIIKSIRRQLSLGMNTKTGWCFGTGKNETYLRKLNEQEGFFENIISLEHPRFIMQYKSGVKGYYIEKYLEAFRGNLTGW